MNTTSSESLFVRTCQECGHKQVANKPVYGSELRLAYCNAKCRKYKSEALDYGSEDFTRNADGKLVKI
jgi:hypothetical protein